VDKLSKRIRIERERRGLSQQQLADRAGISRGYLARLETARQDPTVSTVEKIVRALRIKLAYLFR